MRIISVARFNDRFGEGKSQTATTASSPSLTTKPKIPKTAAGSVPPHSGQAINYEAQIAMFSIANPYGCFGEIPLR